MATVKLAEALLLRKQYQAKVDQLATIKDRDLFELKAKRVNVTENLDDVTAQVPLLSAAQVTSEYDWYSKQLRLVDAAIQQANWTTEITISADANKGYVAPELTRSK